MNPFDDVQNDRFSKTIETHYRAIDPFRKLNRGLVDSYAGSGYGKAESRGPETLINLMNQTVDAYTMSLVANRPRVMISTPHQALSFFARQFQEAVNCLIKEIGLEYTLRQWVLDAFFCMGIIKVHMGDSAPVQLETDLWMDPGQPFASNVSIDNWVHDMGSSKWTQVRFAGDMYRIPYEDLKSNQYEQSVAKDILPTSKWRGDAERLDRISRSEEVDSDEFEPMTDLADIWHPSDQKIYTYAVDSIEHFRIKGKPLAAMDDRMEFGPYHLLGFNDVPQNIIPTSPASHLAGLDRLINNLMRKQRKRANSQRRVNTYTPSGAKGAENVMRAGDDQFVCVDDSKDLGQVQIGGVDPNTQQFMLGSMEMFDRMAGNLTAMLGLGAQADTVGQEQLIHAAASKKEANMLYRVIDGSTRVVRDLGYMLWHDKFKAIKSQIPIDGAEGLFLDTSWFPDERDGEYLDYNFDIDLYSMPYQSPAQQVQAMNFLLTSIYAPMAQQLAEQGGQIDMQEITNTYADMLSQPRIKKWIKFSNPMPEEMPGPQGDDRQRAPAVTSRTNIRRNVPTGGTASSRNQVMQQAWAGGGSGTASPQQMNSLARPPA